MFDKVALDISNFNIIWINQQYELATKGNWLMNNIEQNCPNCGANVPIPKNIYDSLHITCAYCNTLLHIKPIKTPSHFNGTNSYNIKIYGINKKRDKKINKVQTVILILSTVVPLIFLLVFFW